MTETDLEALAAKVEALDGPDKNVDCAIFATVRPDVFGDDAALYARLNWTRNRADWIWLRDQGMPSYTASIDAAMSLVPKGWWWRGGECSVSSDATVGPDVAHCPKEMLVAFDEGFDVVIEPPSNVAIALTAAALRARVSLSRLSPPKEVKHG